jgi:8-oxo-dGTP pyrophosphatase MutT (NUDIX family)
MEFSPHLAAYDTPYESWLKDTLIPKLNSHHQDTTHVATGALIFKYASADAPTKVLLIRRAATDSMPNRWEIPGGACDLEDRSIFHSLAREVQEETGLTVKKVVEWVDGSAYQYDSSSAGGAKGDWDSMYLTDERLNGHGDFFITSTKKLKVVKLSFWVEVEELSGDVREEVQVKLDPKEHSACAWATEAEIVGGEKYELTAEPQRRIILQGFKMATKASGGVT